MIPYNTDLCLSSSNCNCDKFVISDDSVIPNDTVGHSVFGYRKIVVLRPDSTTYTYSSLVTDLADQSINVLTALGINDFNYNFIATDVDGVYKVTIYNFPLWDEAVSYNQILKHIVFHNGFLYRIKATNIGVNPEDDTDEDYWEAYTISDDTIKTRYAKVKRIIILCISLDDCYERLVKEAFCDVNGNPCKGICDNKKFSAASKYLMVKKALCISEGVNDWVSVDKEINLLKSICCCGGGC
jgi:hypothetical protein